MHVCLLLNLAVYIWEREMLGSVCFTESSDTEFRPWIWVNLCSIQPFPVSGKYQAVQVQIMVTTKATELGSQQGHWNNQNKVGVDTREAVIT